MEPLFNAPDFCKVAFPFETPVTKLHFASSDEAATYVERYALDHRFLKEKTYDYDERRKKQRAYRERQAGRLGNLASSRYLFSFFSPLNSYASCFL